MTSPLPDFEAVRAAAARIAAEAVRTPLLTSAHLDAVTGCRVFIKPENLQRTGSFKFRGAYNTLATLTGTERNRGVLAVSSGNHAQGVAEAARFFGASATILMPSDAPQAKIERTQRSGAEVILFDRVHDDREARALELREKTGATFIHPFNDPRVIAGQGTAALEACQDMVAAGVRADHILVCTGGGGLTAGTVLSAAALMPQAVVHTCEPEGFDDYRRSLLSGRIEANERLGGSVCDAIITPSPGAIGFAINQPRLGEGLVVSDEEALRAVAFAFRELKLVVEPGGAVALAGVMKNRDRFAGRTVLILLSGGNIDAAVLERALRLPETR